jgi:adenylosuccinate synthase
VETKYTAVIGASYGDEGKGRLTNYLSDGGTLVTRYSGSAQAAHTVVENGKRHVFKHFGSGTMRGSPTFLTKGFLCHPVEFRSEHARLLELGETPTVFVDEECLLVLPSDMLINQFQEIQRGDLKHGSCGMGIRQAIERCATPELRTQVRDVSRLVLGGAFDVMVRHLESWAWRNHTTAGRILHECGISDFRAVAERFTEDLAYFQHSVLPATSRELSENFLTAGQVLFEGSQGLALDPGVGKLPWLTPTYVGVGGLLPVMRDVFAPEIELIYATRPYLTRHGAGPLPEEHLWEIPVTDETNVPNKWQDSLRFAPLNFQHLRQRIGLDFQWARMWPWPEVKFTVSLGVTCLDHVQDLDFPFIDQTGRQKTGVSKFLNECDDFLDELGSACDKRGRGRLITCFSEDPADTHESREGIDVRVA